jgi:HSP20 family protein
MAIVSFDPFKQFDGWQNAFDEFLAQPNISSQSSLGTPIADVYVEEDKDKHTLVVEAHLPNFSKDEIEVNAHQDMLEIRAEHTSQDTEKHNKRYVLRESSSSFYRRFGLPKNVDTSKVNADFNDGVLKIHIHFKELPKPKKISIDSSKSKKTKK